ARAIAASGGAAGKGAKGREAKKEAIGPADAALRLAPDDPHVQFNDGTAHLGGGDPHGALPLLTRAAEAAGRSAARGSAEPAERSFAAAASYNLGNARMAGGDAAGAVEAYEQALRADTGDADAKWNLELALKQRERDRLRAKQPREGSRGDRGGGRDTSKKPGSDPAERADQQKGPQGQTPGRDQQQQAGQTPGQAGQKGRPEPRPGEQPLPQFKDQPDMSAAEAAALLESVQNLERQQRRAQAAQQAKRRSAKVKDW
ncbi:MAG TPA: hypothetical protein VOA87_23155, partial [Thermoanaerobaculia bacterium]|nr:hypothetical protein [Thermoanaerobaculia bacterium]